MTYLTIRKALNKAFLKVKPQRAEIDNFKTELKQLLNRVNAAEHEEFNKNLLSDFLKKIAFEGKHFINTKGRNDLVIHLENEAKSAVGVIIEAKRPDNKSEMLSLTNLNAKALQELVLYYLRERITDKNLAVKHLIATDTQEWFLFDAQEFEKHFGSDKKLIKQFTEFEAGNLSGKNTDFFYKNIAQPAIEKIKDSLTFTYFDLRQYEKIANGNDAELDKKLIPLYKILSPEHLLKLPFANDSNSLDKKFYAELLHLIGLEEVGKSKKTIERLPKGKRNAGSLLENTLVQLESTNKIHRLDNLKQYGDTATEQLEAVALELVITWVNRILFLKLLEAQLLTYHKGDKSYAFLNFEKLSEFDELSALFFQVLAKKPNERTDFNLETFGNVPYLNSSLFEPTELEDDTIYINALRDKHTLPLLSNTVLKDANGKPQTGSRNTLDYLFAFLDAYDFGSEGTEDIQEQQKTIINAAVLGLIFEKINGYKDGSFFTPGFITMYMCRETLRRAVIQKFNDTKGWHCDNFEDLYDKIEDRKEANEIVNSLKICDPAVGSGHFLVSALNEMIAVKHDLKILQDTDGKRIKEYTFKVENDELIVFDEDDGDLFQYNPKSKESLRIQKMLFHEKQTIIENCLFGVDINPNSVKICRLRLWIELLKNAYYKNENELETLPNIDINIKCGNSLISRFELDTDLKSVLKKNKSKWDISAYRNAVATYRNAEDKAQKREMLAFINAVKNDFQQDIYLNDPKNKQLKKLMGDRMLIENKAAIGDLFEKLSEKDIETDLTKVNEKIEQLEQEIEDVKHNKIFHNAFEWRFEFPEVLNDEGDFVGFDVVIGNPPYMRVQEIQKSQPLGKIFYEQNYQVAKAAYDLANLFFERAVQVSNKFASNAFIFPHKFFNSKSTEIFRDYLEKGQFIDKITHFGANMIFPDADTYTCIAQFSSVANEGFYCYKSVYKDDFALKMLDNNNYGYTTYKALKQLSNLYGTNQWILLDNDLAVELFKNIYINSKKIEQVFEGIYQGIATSKDELYVGELIIENKNSYVLNFPKLNKQYEVEKEFFKPMLKGKDVHRYAYLQTPLYVFFPYMIDKENYSIPKLDKLQKDFPKTFDYIMDNEKMFKARESKKAAKMEYWYGYIYPKNLTKFNQMKLSSMEICAKHPNVSINDGLYHNTKVYSWVKKETTIESYEYLLAIANSQLLWWFLKQTGDTLQGDARTFKTNYLNPFPLPKSVSKEKDTEIATKVTAILSQKAADPKADTSELEKEIDVLVYELYGLTEEEIALIVNC